jgi:F-box protein 18 (helicase)
MQLTDEQEAICSSSGKCIVVDAFAGCAKTSTLVEYARRRPSRNFLYLAFNKAIKQDAEKRFPSNVKCMTTHGIAFPKFGSAYQHKLGNPKPYQVAKVLDWDIVSAGKALEVVMAFIASSDEKINEVHAQQAGLSERVFGMAIDGANALWNAMLDTGNKAALLPHDGYIKLYANSKPVIQTECLLFDEAQDTAPPILSVVLNQACRKVVVGDQHQQIYAWRGAVNGMGSFANHADAQYYLTSSFRFGKGIADLATALLHDWRGESRPLRGLGKNVTQWGVDKDSPHTIIARTNSGLFDSAVAQVIAKRPFGFIGGVNSYKFDMVLDAYRLHAGAPSMVQDKFLQSFATWADLVSYAESLDDKESKALIKVVDTYGRDIPKLIERIKTDARETLRGDEILMVTGHKAKGLEWNHVRLLDDFTDLKTYEDKETKEIVRPKEEEINLLYVACTRALKSLHVNDKIVGWLREEDHRHLLFPILAGFKNGGANSSIPNPVTEGSDDVVVNVQNLISTLRSGGSLSKQESLFVAGIVEQWSGHGNA